MKIEWGNELSAWSLAPDDPLNEDATLFSTGLEELRSEEGLMEILLGDSLFGYEEMPIMVAFIAKADEERDLVVFAPSVGVSVADDINHVMLLPLTEEYDLYWYETTVCDYGPDDYGDYDTGAIWFIDVEDDYTEFDIYYLYISLNL